jgi:hypothetical protein
MKIVLQKRVKKEDLNHTHTQKAHMSLLNLKMRKKSSVLIKQLTFELKCSQHYVSKTDVEQLL